MRPTACASSHCLQVSLPSVLPPTALFVSDQYSLSDVTEDDMGFVMLLSCGALCGLSGAAACKPSKAAVWHWVPGGYQLSHFCVTCCVEATQLLERHSALGSLQVVGFLILIAGTSMYNELLRGCLPGVPPPVPQDEDSLEVTPLPPPGHLLACFACALLKPVPCA